MRVRVRVRVRVSLELELGPGLANPCGSHAGPEPALPLRC